jgi:hypothetical protein
MPFETFDLGRVFATAEAIRGQRRAAESDNLQRMYLQQRIDQGNQTFQQQQQDRQYEVDQRTAREKYLEAHALEMSQDPIADAQVYAPDLVKSFEAKNGAGSFAQADPTQIKSLAQQMKNMMAAKAGIQAPTRLETIEGPGGALLQRNPTTGAINQVVAPQKSNEITPYQQERLNLERQRLSQSSGSQQITPYQQAQLDLQRERIAASKENAAVKAQASGDKTTEGEKSSANYLSRMEAAENLLGTGYTPTTKDFFAANRLMASQGGLQSSLANQWLSDEGKAYYQAANDWVRAKLRKESGASIPADEMLQEIKTYFPVPGDPAAVVEQKRQARIIASEGMRGMAGRAAPQKPQRPQINSEQDYAALPSGTQYTAPDGSIRTKR